MSIVSPLGFLDRGWKIFPCHSITDGKCTCGKKDCGSPGKHPRTRQGVSDASNDPAVVDEWSRNWADKGINWALATGSESNVIVIDIDQKSGGFGSFDEYETKRNSELPKTLTSRTGGNGRHLFFSYPAGLTVPNRVNWLTSVDVRSDGGYVILAPGTHISGGSYQWHNDLPLVEMPADVAQDIIFKRGGAESSAPEMDLTDVAGIFEGLSEGKRDDTLFRWACRLRRQHAGDADGGLQAVTLLVMAAAQKANFPAAEAKKCIESAFKQDHTDELEELELRSLDEIGFRDRFLDVHGSHLRYRTDTGDWVDSTVEGTHWAVAVQEDIDELCEDVAELLLREKAVVADPDTQKKYDKAITQSRSAAGLANIERLARKSSKVKRTAEEFDTSFTSVATPAGVLDLTTGAVEPFNPKKHDHTRITKASYNPDARPGRWNSYITTAIPDDEMREAVQIAGGYSLTGLIKEEVLFQVIGPKASGKSVLLRSFGLFGDLAGTAQVSSFFGREDPAPLEVARMHGVHHLSLSEIKDTAKWNAAFTKRATGGDKLTGREHYKQSFDFTPRFKLWMVANFLPEGLDDALIRRIFRIEFPHTIPVTERDLSLKDDLDRDPALMEEAFSWWVQGAIKYFERGGLLTPASVVDARAAMEEETDLVSRFADECLELDEDYYIHPKTLTAAIRRWNTAGQGAPELSADKVRSLIGEVNSRLRSRPTGSDVRPITADGKKGPRHIPGFRLADTFWVENFITLNSLESRQYAGTH
ncbi:hypothetical protein G9E11_12195 [Arthrobacter sp. IA7]|uniref:phage/plasmid primase, P4 family n=1 Tax=Arthrobacter ipis TaxID=2716202 RepID=UPI001688F1DC|nr:phage/plasmid primase, P4 family [Arthrobacter ipis]MBD1542992.1 hypothetical protein [Arthrobacter ipis]